MSKKENIFLLMLMPTLISGCDSIPEKTPLVDGYMNKNAIEVEKKLVNKGFKCIHQNLLITEINSGKSNIDPYRNKLICYVLQEKFLCPDKKIITLIYDKNSGYIVSKVFFSREKQCF